MHVFNIGGWAWNWGWGLAATIVGVIFLAIFLIPWFFFLLNLNNLLDQVDPRRRAMPPGHVWLNFIPVFNLGWFLYTVVRVRDSVRAEYAARGWAPDGDFGYSVGVIAGVLGILSVFRFPFLGWLVSIGALVCWIVYWLKTADLRRRLESGVNQPRDYAGTQYAPPPPPPYAPWTEQPTGQPSSPPAGWEAPPQTPAQPSGQPTEPPAQPAGQPNVPASAQPAGEGAPVERTGGFCAACGTEYGPRDAYCRTCGMKLP
jgi:hypothetical protein